MCQKDYFGRKLNKAIAESNEGIDETEDSLDELQTVQ